jgi:hypothetical protein
MEKLTIRLILIFLVSAYGNIIKSQTVNVRILEDGKLIPGKVAVMKNGEKYPLSETSYKHIAIRNNIYYTSSGEAKMTLTPGKYTLWIGRGMEYSAVKKDLEIKNIQKDISINASLQKAIDTRGYISGDMHLHTLTFSGHGDASVEERLVSCAAEGLEWAVATDHNYVTDYQPYLGKLGIEGIMATSVANEVSTFIGHFNTYPLTPTTKTVGVTERDGTKLFQNIRDNSENPIVIQINHPRWVATDFFNTKNLDPYFGTSSHPQWSTGFDAIEVLNATSKIGWKVASDNLESVKRDWFNLLNRNIRITGLGNSDSHSVINLIAGSPRNYIASSTDDPALVDEAELSRNVLANKVIIAEGIFVEASISGMPVGSEVAYRGEPIPMKIKVQAADWIDCDRVKLVRNGIEIIEIPVQKSKKKVRLDTTILISPDIDSWYLIIAEGDDEMGPLCELPSGPITPLGFSNPIWVDVRGNGFSSLENHVKNYFKEIIEESQLELDLRLMPEMTPFVLQQVLNSNDKRHLKLITSTILDRGNAEETGFLLQKIMKLDHPISDSIYANYIAKSPFEEMQLEYYRNYPDESKFSNFIDSELKSKQQLKYLLNRYRYISEGSEKQQLQIIDSEGKKQGDNSLLGVCTIPPGGHIEMELFRRSAGLQDFYVSTDQDVKIEVNEKYQGLFRKNNNKKFLYKNKRVELEKLKNKIVIKPSDESQETLISFMEINPDGIIDNRLEQLESVSHLGVNSEVVYTNKYNKKYHGFDIALTDGLRGTTSYSDQLWQGWEGETAEFILELDKAHRISEISIGMLSSQSSWIFYPKEIEIFVGKSDSDFKKECTIPIELKKIPGSQKRDVSCKLDKEAKYIKVRATPLTQIPDWHEASGEKGWLFLDEVIVK